MNSCTCTNLDYACRRGHPECVKKYLNYTNVNTRINGWTPVERTIAKDHHNCLSILIKFGANINDQDYSEECILKGYTPLMYACDWESKECVKVLLDANADMYLVDENGNNATHLCICENSSKYILRMLLEYGADPHFKVINGKSAYELAEIGGYIETIQLMDEYCHLTKCAE